MLRLTDWNDLSRNSLDSSIKYQKCPYSEFFWSAFSCIPTEYGEKRSYLSVFSQKAGKCGQEKFWIRTIFTQWKRSPTLIFWSHQNRYLKKSLDVSHRYIFSKVYLKPCQTSIIKLFAGWKPVTVLQEKLDHRSLIGSSKHTAF